MLEHVLIGKVHTLCRNMLFPEWRHIGLDARRILSGIPGIRLGTEGGRIGALGGLRQGLMGELIVARQPAGIVADLDACRERHSRRLGSRRVVPHLFAAVGSPGSCESGTRLSSRELTPCRIR